MAAKKPGAQSTVTLKHLAANLSASHELSKKQAEAMLGELVNLVTKHLKKGDRVRIPGVGVLVVRRRHAQTGEAGQIKSRVVGTTPDGVKILRPIARPKHFTSKEIRKAISDVKEAATG
jgi:nucleoid DNA-binding protein